MLAHGGGILCALDESVKHFHTSPLLSRRVAEASRPKQRESGNSSPQLGITKAGDRDLRRLLVQSAHYILGPFGPDTDLRRWGLKLTERGGKNAKKRALVAAARKLAVLLHRLWVTGEVYQPLREANPKQALEAA